jgi:GNAT superfamily N-acetyltransferase
MTITATETDLEHIRPWRDSYRQEMSCQIIHDSIHARPGWTREFMLRVGEMPVGYGSLAVAGPWREKATLYEFHVLSQHRMHAFRLFEALLASSGSVAIETQSNDAQLTAMLHMYGRDVISEAVLFEDGITTSLAPPAGCALRRRNEDDAARVFPHHCEPVGDWLIEADGAIVATGGILYHYNRPYGDIYMEVGEPFRRRGIGSYLVQELKRICYEGGSVPAARTGLDNIPSRQTCQKAGFVPCGHILVGSLVPQQQART